MTNNFHARIKFERKHSAAHTAAMSHAVCTRKDELAVPMRLRALMMVAQCNRADTGTMSRSSSKARSPAAQRQPVRVSAASRRLVAQHLMKHARETWKKRTEKLDLIAPDSMVAPRALDFVLPKLELQPQHVVVDLGCGDARWLVAAAQRCVCVYVCAHVCVDWVWVWTWGRVHRRV